MKKLFKMKKLIPFLIVSIILISCNKDVKKKSTPIKDIPLNERAIPTLPGTAANSIIGGAHYICPKSCVGGNGTAAGKCPVCETEMAHNQGFHIGKNNANATAPSLLNSATSTGDLPNANGQYHYTLLQKGCTVRRKGKGRILC